MNLTSRLAPTGQKVGAIILLLVVGVPFCAMTAIAESRPRLIWMSILMLVFAAAGFVATLGFTLILLSVLGYCAAYCFVSLWDTKFGVYAQMALWRLVLMALAFGIGYLAAHGFELSIPAVHIQVPPSR